MKCLEEGESLQNRESSPFEIHTQSFRFDHNLTKEKHRTDPFERFPEDNQDLNRYSCSRAKLNDLLPQVLWDGSHTTIDVINFLSRRIVTWTTKGVSSLQVAKWVWKYSLFEDRMLEWNIWVKQRSHPYLRTSNRNARSQWSTYTVKISIYRIPWALKRIYMELEVTKYNQLTQFINGNTTGYQLW